MPEGDDKELVRNDPESEATFPRLKDVIAEELFVRAAMGDQIETQDDADNFAGFAADAVLTAFVVRERTSPRYTWRDT